MKTLVPFTKVRILGKTYGFPLDVVEWNRYDIALVGRRIRNTNRYALIGGVGVFNREDLQVIGDIKIL